ncbi:cellulose binding domain-containing protein [Polymorphospora rubra]|nr:cellulose binding domain-containing protein [Polymorphospora rubra]
MGLRVRIAVLAVLGVTALLIGAAPTSAAPAAAAADEPPPVCLITTSTVAWDGGYQVEVTIKNVSSGRITWQGKLTAPPWTITGWDATFAGFGSQYTIDPPAHAPILGSNAIAEFGYVGTGNGAALPTITCKPSN